MVKVIVYCMDMNLELWMKKFIRKTENSRDVFSETNIANILNRQDNNNNN